MGLTVGSTTGAGALPYPRSGAVAGAVSVLVFTWVHDLVISDIWAMLVPMLLAGAACGACLGWTYRRLAARPTVAGWLRYNATHLVMFGLLGALSVAVFEPVTTMAAVATTNAPPHDLIAQAMPMTIVFTLVTAVSVTWLHGRRWRELGPVLVTVTVLVALLGLNVSAIGLVEIPSGSAYVIAELFGLIAALDVVFALVFVGLERASLAVHPSSGLAPPPGSISAG